MRKPVILLADNDAAFLDTRAEFLEQGGYRVVSAYDPIEARRRLEDGGIDLAIIDVRLTNDDDEGDISGLLLAREVEPSVPKIMMTAYPSYESVREAMRPRSDGSPAAVDFLSKEEGVEVMLAAVRRVLESTRLSPSAGAPT